VQISGGRLTLNASTVTVGGEWDLTGGYFDPGFSTVTFNALSTSNRNILSGGYGFAHVIFNRLSGNWTLGDNFATTGNLTLTDGTLNTGSDYAVSVSSNLTIGGGTLTANNSQITVTRNWTRNSGAFNQGNSTVTFNGGVAQTLTGSTTFYHLSALTTNTTLQFTSGTTYYVSGVLTLQNVSIKSVTDTATWYLNFSGSTHTVNTIRIRDSNATPGFQLAARSGSVNVTANNWNWDVFGPQAITNLSALRVLNESLDLSWTAPGDETATGTITTGRFVIQYTTVTTFAISSFVGGLSRGSGAPILIHFSSAAISTSGIFPPLFFGGI
jgi:hypothetical protein